MWSLPSPTKYIKNTLTCGLVLTEHLLNPSRRPQTSRGVIQSLHNLGLAEVLVGMQCSSFPTGADPEYSLGNNSHLITGQESLLVSRRLKETKASGMTVAEACSYSWGDRLSPKPPWPPNKTAFPAESLLVLLWWQGISTNGILLPWYDLALCGNNCDQETPMKRDVCVYISVHVSHIKWVTNEHVTQTSLVTQGWFWKELKRSVGKNCVLYAAWAVSWTAGEMQSLCWKDELARKNAAIRTG